MPAASTPPVGPGSGPGAGDPTSGAPGSDGQGSAEPGCDPPGPSPAPVLVVGEALVDIVGGGGRAQRHVGGSPANVAVGLARLGHVVRLATQIGRDADGDLIADHLRAEGVTLADGSLGDGPTSTALATLDDAGAAEYTFGITWALPGVDLGGLRLAGHLHTGSIAATLAPGAAAVHRAVAAARAAGLTTSYDPNARPRIMAAPDVERPGIERLVAGSDVVKASDEDLAWLYPGEPVEQVVARWLADPAATGAASTGARAAGPALVVITRGGQGATATLATDPGHPLLVPQRPVQVVDTVGAGDAFMAGLLSGLLDAGLLGTGPLDAAAPRAAAPRAEAPNTDPPGQALRRAGYPAIRPALARAAAAAAITCGRAGAQPPTRDELGATSW
jgi:fructokinase